MPGDPDPLPRHRKTCYHLISAGRLVRRLVAERRSVEPLYFGDAQRQLFGIYHAPMGSFQKATAVLLCNPFGQEAIIAHRIFRVLGARLSRSGFPVLRFDYYGTGDSSGDGADGDQTIWVQDLRVAHDFLCGLSKSSKVVWVGLRYGASLSLLASQEPIAGLAHLVMWDPVLRGDMYLDELWRDHCSSLASDLESWLPGLPREALGFPITATLDAQLRALDLSCCRPANLARVTLVESTRTSDNDRLAAALSELTHVDLVSVSTKSPWNSEEALNSAIVPIEIVNAIVQLLGANA